MPSFKKINKKVYKPPKLDEALIEKICNVMRAGAYVETAAVVSGVSKVTFYAWLKLAHKRPKSIYQQLLNAVERACEECTTRDLLNIDKCAMGQEFEYEKYGKNAFDENGKSLEGELILGYQNKPIIKKIGLSPDWKASAWRMERRNPKVWAKTEKHEHTGKDGEALPPQVVVTLPSNGREIGKSEPTKD